MDTQIQKALELHRSGNFDGALAAYKEIIKDNPNHMLAVLNSVKILEAREELHKAIAIIEAAERAGGISPEVILEYSKLLLVLGHLDHATQIARQHIAALPHRYEGRLALGVALHAQDKADEAAEAFGAAFSIKPTLARRFEGTELAVYASRYRGKVIDLAMRGSPANHESPSKRRVRSWPINLMISDMASLEKAVKNHVLRHLEIPDKFISSSARIVTLGSCFATNIGSALKASGVDTTIATIAEDVNSTYANKYMLEWLVHGARDDVTKTMERAYGAPIREQLLHSLRAANVVMMTIGVAPCLFRVSDGSFVLKTDELKHGDDSVELRTTTVGENVLNLSASLRLLLSINPTIKVVLTVSPVPLAGTNEMESSVIADCLSKSVVRLAVHEIAQSDPGVFYWPSFEIVRWLGAHTGFSVFGEHDGNSRHVNKDIVDMIVRLFITYCGHGEILEKTAPHHKVSNS